MEPVPVHVLVLTTAYPSHQDVRRFVAALAAAGTRATVLVPGDSTPGEVQQRGNVQIVPVADLPPMIGPDERLQWTLQLNSALAAAGTRIEPDVVHAIGWDVAWAAQILSSVHRAALVWSPGPGVDPSRMSDEHAHAAREAAAWLARGSSETLTLRLPSILGRTSLMQRRLAGRAADAYARAARRNGRRRARAAGLRDGDARDRLA